MPSKSTKSKASGSSSHHKANSIPKANPLAASRPAQSYVVIDATLPSHIINNHSLFTTYIPGRKIHRTAFGHNIMIEGTGDVHIRVLAAGQYICFRMRNCWHVPSSPHHFLSCAVVASSGYQVMIAARTPRMLFPNHRRLAEPRLPKYVPLTKIDGYWALNFEIPAPESISSQLLSTTSQTTAQDPISQALHASTSRPFAGLTFNSLLPTQTPQRLEPFTALSLLQPNLPLLSFAPVTDNFQSATTVSMFSQYNALLDSRCARHIVRDRRLFCSYASAEESMSVDTANCGSLDVLGIGDIEFRCPFRDRHVVFTMRGCLYAPEAPINLLSVSTLVERGMSCLFSSGCLTKVFYPQNHAKLSGFAFSVVVMNRLSFLKLVFLPPSEAPVDSVLPKYTPFVQPSSSESESSHLFAGLTSNHNRLPASSPRQHSDMVSHASTVVAMVINDAAEDAALVLALPAHGGAMITEAAKLSALDLDHDFSQVNTHPSPSLTDSTPLPYIPPAGIGFNRTPLEISKLDTREDVALHGGADTLMDVDFGVVPVNGSGDNFIYRSSAPFLPCFSFLPSPLNFNDITCFPYPSFKLYFWDNSSFRSSISQFPMSIRVFSSSFSVLTLYFHVVSSQVFSLSATFLFQISPLRPHDFSVISPVHFEISSFSTITVSLRALARQLFSGVAVQIQPEPLFPLSQSLFLNSQFRAFVFLLSTFRCLGRFSIVLVPCSRATTHGRNRTNLLVVYEEPHREEWCTWDLNGWYSFSNDMPVISSFPSYLPVRYSFPRRLQYSQSQSQLSLLFVSAVFINGSNTTGTGIHPNSVSPSHPRTPSVFPSFLCTSGFTMTLFGFCTLFHFISYYLFYLLLYYISSFFLAFRLFLFFFFFFLCSFSFFTFQST